MAERAAPIRPARAADLPAILACAEAAYGKYVARMGKKPGPMLADYQDQIAAGLVHVLEHDADVAGFIVLMARADHLFVENVALDPAHHGQGLGRRLMTFAEERAQELGLGGIRLYTNVKMTENFPFYERLGYQITERRTEDGYDRVYFLKRLV
ncbi:MAG: GNAT family N-acetyltransferase [Pseudomonadota bacterium]